MSAETFTTALFLITAVVASGVLINAVFPVVYNMAGTFSSATHESDERLRTDFKIVTYHSTSGDSPEVNIWMKNIGSAKIPVADIALSDEDTARSDVFCGPEENYGRLNYVVSDPVKGQWTTDFFTDPSYNLNNKNYWDPGETLHIIARPNTAISSGGTVYFQFILPSGTWRSQTFNAG